ncbi:MAG: hypothetical protein QOK05_3005 [Chloroflexota bacterium]|jgi:FkbM family methyltransferase|nr:hypothetical protein [Chloroflexota bacterium]
MRTGNQPSDRLTAEDGLARSRRARGRAGAGAAGSPTVLGAAGRLVRRAVHRMSRAQVEPLVESLAALEDSITALLPPAPAGVDSAVALAAQLGFLRFSASAGGDADLTRNLSTFLAAAVPYSVLPSVVDVQTDVGSLYIAAHDEAILDYLRREGTWEPLEAAAIRVQVTPGMTVLDLGAHVGYRTILLSQLVGPEGRVIAVEASPVNFAILNANLQRRGLANVITLPIAAGERTGEVELAVSATNTGDNRLFARDGEATVRVPMHPIGTLLPDDARLDFIKCDLQGYDQRALRGMEDLLKLRHPRIVVEFCPRDIRDVGDDPVETLTYYRGLGYDVAVIDREVVTATDAEVMAQAAAAEHKYVNLLLTA